MNKPYQEKTLSYGLKKNIINEYVENKKSIRTIAKNLKLSDYLVKCVLQEYFKKTGIKIIALNEAKKKMNLMTDFEKNLIVSCYKKNNFSIEKTKEIFPDHTKITIERIIIEHVNNIPRQEGMSSFISMITL